MTAPYFWHSSLTSSAISCSHPGSVSLQNSGTYEHTAVKVVTSVIAVDQCIFPPNSSGKAWKAADWELARNQGLIIWSIGSCSTAVGLNVRCSGGMTMWLCASELWQEHLAGAGERCGAAHVEGSNMFFRRRQTVGMGEDGPKMPCSYTMPWSAMTTPAEGMDTGAPGGGGMPMPTPPMPGGPGGVPRGTLFAPEPIADAPGGGP